MPIRDLDHPSPDRPLRVAFVAAHGVHKGAELIRKIVQRRYLDCGVPVEWHMIGTIRGGGRGLVDHGAYHRDELPAILRRVAPDLVAILSICPETYCYTLDEALSAGIPVVVTPLGDRRPSGSSTIGAAGCSVTLRSAPSSAVWSRSPARGNLIAPSGGESPAIPRRSAEQVAGQYRAEYLRSVSPEQRPSGPRLAAILADLSAASPCPRRPFRGLTAAAMRACLALLNRLRLRSMAEKIVLRFVPHRSVRRLADAIYRATQLPPR